MDILIQAFQLVVRPDVLVTIFLAALFGLFVGAIPGLTATMATALLVPVTFFMEPIPALGAIVTATAMAIFSGDIPAALLRMPGTPASAAYTDESYKLNKKGMLDLTLGTNVTFSAMGGMFGVAILIFAAPWLAEVALRFSSFEYFWLASLGLTCAVFISTTDPVKGFASLFLGLAISTIGIDPVVGHPRFTFGSVELLQGISFIPAMIALFAVSEVLRQALVIGDPTEQVTAHIGNIFKGIGGMVRRYKLNFLRASTIGVAIGALPGAGGDIAAWITYAVSKKFSKEPEKYGTGHIEGIVDATSANNAALAGAWIPALVFGIPGDSITAIVIGVLYMKGMNPGPTVFLKNPQLIYGVFIIFIMANLLLVPLGLIAIKSSKQILRLPRQILIPIILMFCIVGAFAITNSILAVVILLVLGLLGWLLEENGFPVAPIILGMVLGEMLEMNFMTSMIKADGSLLSFFERPIAGVLGALTLFVWAGMLWTGLRPKKPAGA
jgi:putative tricarboxylic transport membrane protein